jgi:hypothetical protein
LLSPAKTFLQVEGTNNENIVIDGGDLKKAVNITAFENGGNKQSVLIKP